jgi:hypothetical protein
MSDPSEYMLKFNKLNRGLNKRKIRIKEIIDPNFLLTVLPDNAIAGYAAPVMISHNQNNKPTVLDNKNMEEVPGEFYESDPEVLSVLIEKPIVDSGELEEMAVLTPLKDISEEQATFEYFESRDKTLIRVGIKNLTRKYN